MSTKVNLTKRVFTPTGKRYYPVVLSANGRVKPGWVVVDGQEEYHPKGSYYIDWTEGGRRRRVSVGKDASTAMNRKLRRETELKAKSQGIALAEEQEAATGTDLAEAISEYLQEIKLVKKPKTLAAYTTALTYFQESCKKRYIEEIERKDMLQFTAFLRDKKRQSPRSCWNKFSNVVTFLKANGITGLLRKGDWPDYVEEQPETYEREDLQKFFAACTPEERLLFEFFLMTGFRYQEVMYVSWQDFKPSQGIVGMTWKKQYGWTPKAYKEREVPVPDTLSEALSAVRPKDGKGLIFGTAKDGPNYHMLDMCKRIAERAGLDPDDWWLHKFRATFATWHLQGGPAGLGKPVDLRTVQEWMGHTDIESTMRYLRPARNETVRDKVNTTFI